MKKNIVLYPKNYRSRPGYMPFPPDTCINAKHIFKSDKMPWIDLAFCAGCEKQCTRRREYNVKEFMAESSRLHKLNFGG